MTKYVILVFLVVATIWVTEISSNINICGDTGACCPKNSELRCCCQKNTITYKASSTKANFWSAYIACKQAGMDLATITSQEEEIALTAYLTTITSAVGYAAGIWIGGSNLGTTSSWYWLKTGEPLVYSAFLPGQPDLASENCLTWLIWQANKTYGWNNYGCNTQLQYVCETRRDCR